MKGVVYDMNTTNLVCDAVYDIVRDDIYRTLVGPTLFGNLTLFCSSRSLRLLVSPSMLIFVLYKFDNLYYVN